MDYLTLIVTAILVVVIFYIIYQVCFAKSPEDGDAKGNNIDNRRLLGVYKETTEANITSGGI